MTPHGIRYTPSTAQVLKELDGWTSLIQWFASLLLDLIIYSLISQGCFYPCGDLLIFCSLLSTSSFLFRIICQSFFIYFWCPNFSWLAAQRVSQGKWYSELPWIQPEAGSLLPGFHLFRFLRHDFFSFFSQTFSCFLALALHCFSHLQLNSLD